MATPAASRLKLMHALAGLGAALCAYYWEPDKWLIGRCDCKYGLADGGGSGEQTGCPEVRDLLARVRARGVPAPCYVVPEALPPLPPCSEGESEPRVAA